ncbi:hypothetical protein [Halorussus halobius]|uniref:hypothetical protein n=1 Tax=Halorussus halobius TaxID=1710537 RepID=UPI001091F5D9|nr:hypothetical protein [Halorussus halobius]
MGDTDDLTERQVRAAVREGTVDAGRSLLSLVVWTVLAAFAVLVGLQLLQFALAASGVAAAGFAGVGTVVVGCSLYLLSDLHRR